MTSRNIRVATFLTALATAAAVPLAGQALAGPADPAQVGAGTPEHGSGWTPYRQHDIDYAAGERCAFPLYGDVVLDREEYKDVAHWPSGQVRTQLWRGALVMEWTNRETGESVRRDQSARAVVEYRADGSMEQMTSLRGAIGVGMREGDGFPGKGAYVVDGRWSSVVMAEDGTRTITLGPRGELENLCETLD